jgi:hypothetical protein
MAKLSYIQRYADFIPVEGKIQLAEYVYATFGENVFIMPYGGAKEVVINITSLVGSEVFIDSAYNIIKFYIDKLNKPKQ